MQSSAWVLGGQEGSPSTMSPCFHPQPLFTMSAQQPSIVPFTQQAYEQLSRQFDPYPVSSPHPDLPGRGRDGWGEGWPGLTLLRCCLCPAGHAVHQPVRP